MELEKAPASAAEKFLDDQVKATDMARELVAFQRITNSFKYDAMVLALRYYEFNGGASNPNQVVDVAKIFEKYIEV